MEMVIKLDIDSSGNPFIKVRHVDSDFSIDSKLLGVFIKNANESGLKIRKVSSGVSVELNGRTSHENYEIKANEYSQK